MVTDAMLIALDSYNFPASHLSPGLNVAVAPAVAYCVYPLLPPPQPVHVPVTVKSVKVPVEAVFAPIAVLSRPFDADNVVNAPAKRMVE